MNRSEVAEPLYRTRPGGSDIRPATFSDLTEVCRGIWLSPGLSNSYMLTTGDGRVIVNTGMGFEGPIHRANFDAIDIGPVRYILLTQGHFDHVGGVDAVRDQETEVVAQANWATWRDDNARLERFRAGNAVFAWKEAITAALEYAREHLGDSVPAQSRPVPSIEFESEYAFDLGARHFELLATPGGETTDSMVVWLPDERVCLCGNVFGALFGHIPNLVTMRGDRYRDALTVIDSIERVRSLRPEVLLTGHFGPIVGEELIDSQLLRLRDAVRYVHDEVIKGMNSGADVWTLMRDVALPPDLDVGEGYGKVSWDVRAVWENYAGWFHHRSTTELYAVEAPAVHRDLVELAGGADAVVARASALLNEVGPLQAIHLAEIALTFDPGHGGARQVMVDAHQRLLDESENFWETAWLREQIGKFSG
jgi:glyoxylase-like metal-dependent hydrolase (beta-lactamase superfamily II)